jgi:pSer/pThr/pTyr-binding forkhead associated (FHA) protein
MEPDIDLPSDVYLEVTSRDGEVSRFALTKKTVTIGRDPGCDLHLVDPYVSRKHCQIVFRGDHFTVMDLGSLNKTVVKDRQYIQKNLVPGTVLSLGQTRLRFLWDGYLQWRREYGVLEEPSGTDEPAPGPGEPQAG